MAKSKQNSAIDLLTSYRNQIYKSLSVEDRVFCNQIISQENNSQCISKFIEDYVNQERNNRHLNQTHLAELSFNICNYMSLFYSLLLSYSNKKNTTLTIPEKYYKSVPNNFLDSTIIIPGLGLIVIIEKLANFAWFGNNKDKAGNVYIIYIYTNEKIWQLKYHVNFIDKQYPRLSILCEGSDECRIFTETTFNIRKPDDSIIDYSGCLMNPNRLKICPRESAFSKKTGVCLQDIIALVLMCFDKWKNRPVRAGTKKWDSFTDTDVSVYIPKTPQWEHSSEGFREVQLRDYFEFAKQNKTGGYKIENRSSPCEHNRRGHTRTLRDGRKVLVRPSIVNKGGEKVIYKV